MAIAFRSVSSVLNTAAVTSFTCTAPTGVASNDVLVAFHYSASTAYVDMTSSEFTQTGADAPTTNSAFRARVWIRTAGGSEPSSYTFGKSSNTDTVIIIVACTGVDTTTSVDAAVAWGNGGTSASVVAPSISPSVTGTFLVCGFGDRVATASSYSSMGALTIRADLAFGQPCGLGTQLLSASGATGTRTGTCSGAAFSGGWNAFSIALNPASTSTTVQAPPPQWPARNFAATY